MVSRVMEVAEEVHRLTNGVANFYLIEESGKLVLVDAGAPKDWALFTQAALGLGKVAGDLDTVLLTHAHTDHTGFAEQARATTGARVWIHEQDVQMARTGKVGPRDCKTRRFRARCLWSSCRGPAAPMADARDAAAWLPLPSVLFPARRAVATRPPVAYRVAQLPVSPGQAA